MSTHSNSSRLSQFVGSIAINDMVSQVMDPVSNFIASVDSFVAPGTKVAMLASNLLGNKVKLSDQICVVEHQNCPL
jgi:hypothetical protein